MSMFRGTVKFCARIVEVEKQITFPLVQIDPHEPGVSILEIEAPGRSEILMATHLDSVCTPEYGRAIAMKLHKTTLDRIAFLYEIAVDDGRITSNEFLDLSPRPPGEYRIAAESGAFAITGAHVNFVVGLNADRVKQELEALTARGVDCSLFRSALLSKSPVEKFMHLYNVLLMFFRDDDQERRVGLMIIFANKTLLFRRRHIPSFRRFTKLFIRDFVLNLAMRAKA